MSSSVPQTTESNSVPASPVAQQPLKRKIKIKKPISGGSKVQSFAERQKQHLQTIKPQPHIAPVGSYHDGTRALPPQIVVEGQEEGEGGALNRTMDEKRCESGARTIEMALSESSIDIRLAHSVSHV